MTDLKKLEVWFVTGSQHLYGEETLKQVAEHSQVIATALNKASQIPVTIVFKPTVKSTEEIYNICAEANASRNVIGIITWMHTFSPAKMWINGLKILQKTFASSAYTIQSRYSLERNRYGFYEPEPKRSWRQRVWIMVSRMRRNRKVVVGHWEDTEVLGFHRRLDKSGCRLARLAGRPLCALW